MKLKLSRNLVDLQYQWELSFAFGTKLQCGGKVSATNSCKTQNLTIGCSKLILYFLAFYLKSEKPSQQIKVKKGLMATKSHFVAKKKLFSYMSKKLANRANLCPEAKKNSNSLIYIM